MKSNINVKNKARISLNEKSKEIKKKNSLFGKIFQKFPLFKLRNRNKKRLIMEKKNEQCKIEKEKCEIEKIKDEIEKDEFEKGKSEIKKEKDEFKKEKNEIKKENDEFEKENYGFINNQNLPSDNSNTIFSFYSNESKNNINNNAEFIDVLKSVENSINNNITLRRLETKPETKSEKIKHFLNILDNKSFSKKKPHNNNSNTKISHQYDYTNNLNNSSKINNNQRIFNSMNEIKRDKEKENFISNPSSNVENEKYFNLWRSKSASVESETDRNSEINTENDNLSTITTNSSIISPNRVLLSESYIPSIKPRKFNSIPNLYFKDSDKEFKRFFSDIPSKYNQKSSYNAYKAAASKYLNRRQTSTPILTNQQNYKDLPSTTREVYKPSSFLIPKTKENKKKKIKNSELDNKWIENIRKKIEHSLSLNDQAKYVEPSQEYYNDLLKIDKLIEEELKENKNFPDLSNEALYSIEEAIGPGNEQEVLIEEFNIPIKRHDIRTLINGKWLNDEVINFYGNLIMERSKNTTNKYPPVYFFNTFFFTTLSDYGYRSVRRWTRKFDIFLYDYIIIPIHLGYHWCCSAINFKKKRFEYYDSLHGSQKNALYLLRNYIQEESKDKKKCEYDLSDWEDYCPKNIPSQLNGYDCGVFTLLFADYISREEQFDFDQSHIEYIRNKIIYEIINKKLLIV